MFGNILIKNIIILGLIIGGGFLSQQPYFQSAGKTLISPFMKKGDSYVTQAADWAKTSLYPKEGGEVMGAIEQEIENQKNNLQKDTTTAIKNFVAQKALQTLGVKPQDLLNSQDLQNLACQK
jgi:hypothetical protein